MLSLIMFIPANVAVLALASLCVTASPVAPGALQPRGTEITIIQSNTTLTLPTSTLTPEQAAALAAGLEDALGSLTDFLPVRRRQDDGATGVIVDIPTITTTSGIALSTNTTSEIESASTVTALSIGDAIEVQDNDLPNHRRQDARDTDVMSEEFDPTSATSNATTSSTTITQSLSLGDTIESSVSDLLFYQRRQEDSDAGVSAIATSTTMATVTDVLLPTSMGWQTQSKL